MTRYLREDIEIYLAGTDAEIEEYERKAEVGYNIENTYGEFLPAKSVESYIFVEALAALGSYLLDVDVLTIPLCVDMAVRTLPWIKGCLETRQLFSTPGAYQGIIGWIRDQRENQ